MDIRPLGPAIGAEILGIDAAQEIDLGDRQRLRKAWAESGLLLLREQTMDEAGLVRFSRNFGELEMPPASAERSYGDGGARRPEIWIISNVVMDGKPIGSLGYGEAEWHTDMSYITAPPTASVLYSVEIPPTGGDTFFASMTKAYAALPEDLTRAVAGRTAKHDSSYTSAGELRRGSKEITDPREAPGASHPIVRIHPETGAPALFLGRRRNGYIDGLSLEESERLLDRLWAHCTDPRFAYRHQWRVGDVLVWDNRQVIHRRDAFDPNTRRIMLRTQIRGEAPLAARAA
ncbi:MAG: TauD/TfdA family dioxygenase [Alphaproteobacteria bacterium]|nr:TauD/TfdA family dioxygenase [Alphaproteobacteria bacterium]